MSARTASIRRRSSARVPRRSKNRRADARRGLKLDCVTRSIRPHALATPPLDGMEPSRARDILGRLRQLLRRWREVPPFGRVVFFAALLTFWWVVPFGDVDTIIGDNIAQVAYFRVLFRPNLVGSIGASSMKPALILLLGAAHELSRVLFASTVL